MKSTRIFVLLLSTLATAVHRHGPESRLVVREAPQHLRPYVLRNLDGQSVAVGQQIYRFSVTGPSSNGAFTLIQTNAPESTTLGVFPHFHKLHYENFYCTKGGVRVWTETNATEDQGRLLTQGDYAAVPRDTLHTFQIMEPDTQLTGVIQPGGFEQLFVAIGDNSFFDSTGSPYVPAAPDPSSGIPSDPNQLAGLKVFDVYAQLDFTPRSDFTNGVAGDGTWHNGENTLAEDDVTPYFVAKNYGPKYLNTQNGYKIIAPLATGKQTANNFTMGTITMSPWMFNETQNPTILHQHVAFQMQEGQISGTVAGEEFSIIQGDVIFIPKGTHFTYFASVPFTKFLYVSAGANGLDYQLMRNSIPWDFATYPTYGGFGG
jgi:quercetin dioxygenase-like cupin family protein